MKRLSLLLITSILLTGCLSKVPLSKRRGDPWQRTSEQLSRPTTLY